MRCARLTRKISSSYGRNFAIVDGEIFDEQFLFRKLDRHQIFLRDAGHHPRATSYPYFWISSEHKQVKLHCCNEFRNEGVVAVPRDNPHSSQKKVFYFSSFLILAAHNAQHQSLISASFCMHRCIAGEYLQTFRSHLLHARASALYQMYAL